MLQATAFGERAQLQALLPRPEVLAAVKTAIKELALCPMQLAIGVHRWATCGQILRLLLQHGVVEFTTAAQAQAVQNVALAASDWEVAAVMGIVLCQVFHTTPESVTLACVGECIPHNLRDLVKGNWDGTWLKLYAASLAFPCIVELVADVNAQDGQGRTALHWAASANHRTSIRALAENGADVNARDVQGMTSLHLAAEANNLASVRVLMECGADVWLKTSRGQTTRDIANHSKIHRALEKPMNANTVKKAGCAGNCAMSPWEGVGVGLTCQIHLVGSSHLCRLSAAGYMGSES